MATAPNVPDFAQFNFELGDTSAVVTKQNGLNAALAQFGSSLATMTESINDDLATMEGQKDATQQAAQSADEDAQQIGLDKQAVADDRAHVDQQKQAVDATAGEVSDNAQQVASDKQTVAADRQTATEAAGTATDAASASIEAKEDAQALYGDLQAVDDAKNASQQAAQDAGEERGLAVEAREGAEQALSDTQQVRNEVDGAVSQAIDDHEAEEHPHSQYAKSDDLGSAAETNTGTGADDVPTTSEADARYAQLAGPNDFDTMPTVNGDPVVEKDSNDAGSFTRWGDGTQYANSAGVSLSSSLGGSSSSGVRVGGIVAWDFPASFSEIPSLFGQTTNDDGAGSNKVGCLPRGTSGSLTSGEFFGFSFEGLSDIELPVFLSAMGYWKSPTS